MIRFAVFKYKISKSDEKNLFTLEGNSNALSAREEFGKLLTGKSLNIYKAGSDGMPELYRTENVFHNDIAVFTIENNRTVSQWVNKQKNSLPSNPYSWVVIDNRSEQMRMYVEHNSAFAQPQNIIDLLEANFNGKFTEIGFKIEISPIPVEKEFWKVVEDRCIKQNDSIKKVVFELVNPEKAEGISLPARRYAFLSSTLGIMEATNTYKSTFAMQANKRDNILLARTRRDLSQMVRLCCNNGYVISVYFRKTGRFVSGDLACVYENVEDELLTLFTSNTTTIDDKGGYTYDLVLWLDSITRNKKKKNERVA